MNRNYCTTVTAAPIDDDAKLLRAIGRAWHRPAHWHSLALLAFRQATALPYYDRLAHACADADHTCAALVKRDRADYDQARQAWRDELAPASIDPFAAVSFAEPWPDEALDAYIQRVEAFDDHTDLQAQVRKVRR